MAVNVTEWDIVWSTFWTTLPA